MIATATVSAPLSARRIARQAAAGQYRSISIGRSRNSAGVSSSTPVEIVAGDAAPELAGRPYLSTCFRRGNFSRNLYTPSTLRIEVGSDWLAARCPEYAALLNIGSGI